MDEQTKRAYYGIVAKGWQMMKADMELPPSVRQCPEADRQWSELIDKYNSLILIIASLLNLPGTVQDMKERKRGCNHSQSESADRILLCPAFFNKQDNGSDNKI